MGEWIKLIPLLGASGVAGWAGNAIMQWLKDRGDRQQARDKGELDLEQHRDGLTFQLLSAARTEIAALTTQVERLRPMEASLYDLAQAMQHIDALLNATGDDRAVVERNARAFLNRMRRNAEARGTIANEAQRAQSAAALGGEQAEN